MCVSAHSQVLCRDLQAIAHVQKVRKAAFIQQQVDGDASLTRCIQKILQDEQVCEEVHDYCYGLTHTHREGDESHVMT